MWVDQFITELQGKYLPFKYPNEKGDLEIHSVPIAVRPIQLWEIVFPEEHKDLMLTTLFNGQISPTQHKKHNKFIYGIRKILGVDKIPKFKTEREIPITKDHIEMIGIGIKKDYWINPKTKEIIQAPSELQKKELFEGL